VLSPQETNVQILASSLLQEIKVAALTYYVFNEEATMT
jgi:hypothetical protein